MAGKRAQRSAAPVSASTRSGVSFKKLVGFTVVPLVLLVAMSSSSAGPAELLGRGLKFMPWLWQFVSNQKLATRAPSEPSFSASASAAKQQNVPDKIERTPAPPRQLASSPLVADWTEGGLSWKTNWARKRDCAALAEPWLYQQGMLRGYHVVCLNAVDAGASAFEAVVYMHGQRNVVKRFSLSNSSSAEFRDAFTRELQMPKLAGVRQPWRFFDRDGRPLREATVEPLMLLFEGGQWLWPGIAKGHVWRIANMVPGRPDLLLETVELQPLVLEVHNFIEASECDIIVNVSKPHFFTSGVAHQDQDIGKDSSQWRTSSQWWFSNAYDPTGTMERVQARVAELTRVPRSHQEHPQILQYLPGQKYVGHLDAFDLNLYKSQTDVLRQYDYGGKNRLSTTFCYLSTVRKGGWTNFPRSGGAPQPTDFNDCSKGLQVPPVKGKVVI